MAIQNMLGWLKTNGASDKPNHQDNLDALAVYRGIEDETARNKFISNFHRSRSYSRSTRSFRVSNSSREP